MESEDESFTCAATTGDASDQNTFKILVASDIHLGYCDNNPARENDSFVTFEEILKVGLDQNVDFVLLGGDLFHENRPKPATLQRTMEIMRKYCFGNKAIEFEYLGDPKVDFRNMDVPEVNFLSPNVNVALPVFTIHGNHDDPVGAKKTSAVDHLVAAKLLNHFGTWENLHQINVKAVPLVKGETKIALYGLGNLKDERLHRLITNNNLKFIRPKESHDEWFNIFVLHQNRVAHGPKNYIPESFIPPFFDIAVWGHEHECQIEPQHSSADVKTFIMQPGSSVATSLCAGEAKEKFCGILYVHRRKFRFEKHKLGTVRPMLVDDIAIPKDPSLKNLCKEKNPAKFLESYTDKKLEIMLKNVKDLLTGHPNQPLEPLVRIRIFYERIEDTFNPVKFAQKYGNKIVNEDIIMFKRIVGKRNEAGEIDVEDMEEMFKHQEDPDLDSHVESIVEDYFAKARASEDQANILEVLSERGLSEAVKSCVEKDDKDALNLIIDAQCDKAIKYLIKKFTNQDEIEAVLQNFRLERASKPNEDGEEAASLLKSRPVPKKRDNSNVDDGEDDIKMEDDDETSVIEDNSDDDDVVVVPVASKSRGGRGAGRGRAAANTNSSRGRGRGRGRGKGSTSNDDGDSSGSAPQTPKPRGGRGSRGGGAKSSPAVKPGTKKPFIQTTLPVVSRRSPRKSAHVFDVSDSD